MKSMTYGTLPSEEEFREAFRRECHTGRFRFGNDPRVGDDSLTATELWIELGSAVYDWEQGDDKSGAWASDVLSVLGFEWV